MNGTTPNKTITTETGDEFPVEAGLDLDSKEAMLDELAYIINDTSEYGIRGEGRGDRLVHLARVSFLASRIAWLESVPISMDELDARARKAAAKMAIDRKVAAGELVRLAGGSVIEAERFDPAVHVRADEEFAGTLAMIREEAEMMAAAGDEDGRE